MRSQCIYCVTKNYSVTQKSATKYCESVICSVMSDSLQPHGLYLPGSSVHGILQAEILQWIAILFSRESSWPRIEPGFSALQVDSLPSEPPLSQFRRSVVSDSLRPHEPQHARPPCPSPTPGVHPNSCPLSRWCPPTISSSVVPFFSCPQSFPASGSFWTSQLFASGGQSIGVSASASVLPMNTQDWSPLGWTGWISLQSKGLSRVFSNTTVQKHQGSPRYCIHL